MNKKGFTLGELIVVTAINTALLAVTIHEGERQEIWHFGCNDRSEVEKLQVEQNYNSTRQYGIDIDEVLAEQPVTTTRPYVTTKPSN